MQLTYNNKDYDVIIEKKHGNRNTYIRVKNDLCIHVTTNYLTPRFSIEKLIHDNYKRICDMIDAQEIKAKNNNGFFYLGNKYTVIYTDTKKVEFMSDNVYVPEDFDKDKWYKKEAKELFSKHFEENYSKFTRHIPKPSLRIRKMTTRWGVCNTRSHVITLNLELIKRDTKYLDYVIIHEMSHLIYGDHSRAFWNLVEENMSDYKKYKNEMKEF